MEWSLFKGILWSGCGLHCRSLSEGRTMVYTSWSFLHSCEGTSVSVSSVMDKTQMAELLRKGRDQLKQLYHCMVQWHLYTEWPSSWGLFSLKGTTVCTLKLCRHEQRGRRWTGISVSLSLTKEELGVSNGSGRVHWPSVAILQYQVVSTIWSDFLLDHFCSFLRSTDFWPDLCC